MTVLLAARIEQIQSYLLSSPRLRQIRGGSQLLLELDGRVRAAVSTAGGSIACAAGGLFLAAFDGPDEVTNGDQAAAGVRGAISRTVPAASSWVTTTTWDPTTSSFRQVIADVMASAVRDRAGAAGPVVDPGFVRPCDVCHVRGARAERRYEWGTQQMCPDCSARAGVAMKDRTIEKRLRELGAWPESERRGRPVTVDDLARGRPGGYVAYIAADGNAIGDRLDRLDNLAALATFSQALQAATAEALVHAVSACHPSSTGVRPDYAGLAAGPVLPVIVGGDDVVVFSAPALGLPLAIEFARSFEKATSSAIGERLTAGTGVVIAHASTPFGTLDAAAHRLQKKAKALHRRVGGSTVAFAIVSGGPSGDVGPERLDPSDALSHARSLGVDAYSVDDAALLVTTALKLKALGTPPSKLRQLAEVLRASHHGVDADWELVLASRSMSQARGLIERVAELPPKSKPYGVEPWRDLDGVVLTAVPDLLALAAIL